MYKTNCLIWRVKLNLWMCKMAKNKPSPSVGYQTVVPRHWVGPRETAERCNTRLVLTQTCLSSSIKYKSSQDSCVLSMCVWLCVCKVVFSVCGGSGRDSALLSLQHIWHHIWRAIISLLSLKDEVIKCVFVCVLGGGADLECDLMFVFVNI